MDRAMKDMLIDYIRSGELPPSGDEARRQLMREIGVRNMFIKSRLSGLLSALGPQDVQAIVMKGAHLIQSIYPFGVRPIEDIDILADRSCQQKIDEALRGLGYAARIEGMDLWTHMTFSNKITYIRKGEFPLIPIDVHFSLGPYPYLGKLSYERLRSETAELRTPDGSLRVLKPEMLLIHLCLHLFQHHFDDWEVSCCDIVAVVRSLGDALDWERVVRLTRELGIGLPVAYALEKARELSPIEIPAELLPGRMSSTAWERWVFRRSLKQRTPFDRYVLQFLTTPGAGAKLRGAVKIIAPGRRQLQLYHGGNYLRYLREVWKSASR